MEMERDLLILFKGIEESVGAGEFCWPVNNGRSVLAPGRYTHKERLTISRPSRRLTISFSLNENKEI
jgi:hypothetical protein